MKRTNKTDNMKPATMEDEEILSGNKLIAEFMGGIAHGNFFYQFPYEFGYKETHDEGGFVGSGPDSCWEFNELQYHTSWDWLMPVAEKIEQLKYTVYIFNDYCRIEKEIGEVICHSVYPHEPEPKSKIDATFKTIMQFIKWYNENK